MHILNEFFDKVYIITCEQGFSRYKNLSAFLGSKNIKFDVMVSPPKRYFTDIKYGSGEKDLFRSGSISVACGRMSVFNIAKLKNYKNLLLLEDDCFFLKGWEENIQSIFSDLPSKWDILNLGFLSNSSPSEEANTNQKEKITDNIGKVKEIWGSHAIAYNNTVFDEVIDMFNTHQKPFDYTLQYIYQNNKYSCYTAMKKLIVQKSYRSWYDTSVLPKYQNSPSLIA